MSAITYIGLDDTDVLGGPGTGRLARGMAERLIELGFGQSLGVTRHQLLVDPRIKYTSHNSSLCIGLRSDRSMSAMYAPCIEYMREHFQPGSDPGLCICEEGQIDDECLRFGRNATQIVLSKQKAVSLAAKAGIFLRELGGSGDGVIGALAAVALRIEGNQGRFVALNGIRAIQGLVTVGELKELTGIRTILDTQGHTLGDGEVVDSLDWVRPSLFERQAILIVKRTLPPGRESVWAPAERRKGDANKDRKG